MNAPQTLPPGGPSHWHNDLARGEAGEITWANYFTGRGVTTYKAVGLHPGYDLMLLQRIEIKTDFLAESTGNFAIELSRDGQPTGISISTADLWGLTCGKTGYLVRTSVLRQLVESGNYPIVVAGDGLRTKCCLVRVEAVAARSKIIDLRGTAPSPPARPPRIAAQLPAAATPGVGPDDMPILNPDAGNGHLRPPANVLTDTRIVENTAIPLRGSSGRAET